MTFGEKCTDSIRAYLKANNLKSIGALNASIIADLIDRVYDHSLQVEQADKDRKKAIATAKREKVNEQPTPDANKATLFEALANVCGMAVNEMTRGAASSCGLALAQILEVMPNVTKEEIWKRGKLYKKTYPQASLSPTSLSLHWPKFGGTGTFVNEPTENFHMKEDDPYAEPKWDWRSIAIGRWPKKDYPHLEYLEKIEWKDLTLTLKNMLKNELKPL